jgi:hypothetical protein
MNDHAIKKFGKLTVGATLVLLLGGCLGGGDSSSSTTLQGTAMAGPFLTGTVCAYKVTNGAKGATLGSCSVIASATSSFTLNVGDYVGDVLLEVSNASYDDEANPNDNVIGTPLSGTMRNLIHIANPGETVEVAVTPLTEAALRLAGATLNNNTVQAAIDQLESLMQMGSGLDLRTTPPLASTAAGMAYREALRALSEHQWGASGNGDFAGKLDSYLSNLVGQIGVNGSTLATELENQINANLDSNCSTSSGTIVCTVPGTGGTGGTGGTDTSGGTGNTGGTDTSGGTGNTGGTDTSGGTGNTGGTGGATAAAACSSAAVPAGMNYSVNGNNITVTTTGCITLPTAGICVPPAPTQATGINILQTSTAGNASLSGLTFNIPGGNNPFGDIGAAYAGGKACLKNAPDGMSNWNINYNVCYDITSQVAPALAAVPAGMVTVANQITIAANGTTTMQTVADCFTSGADSITDALTGEIWSKQADGSYLKLN